MKIKEIISEERIIFDNGNEITFYHDRDCCEWNWADFDAIRNDVNIHHDFDENLIFDFHDGLGFSFGDSECKIVVPCYSDQNGYYSIDIDILYNGTSVAHGDCEERFL